MARGAEAVREAHGIAQLEDLVVSKLDNPVARSAVQVIMRGVAVVVLVGTAIGQPQLAQSPDSTSSRNVR